MKFSKIYIAINLICIMVLVALDYIFIVLYFLLLIVIGYIASRRQTSESFLISERKLKFLSGIATINATKTGAILLVFTALLYLYGFSAMWYFIGIVLGYLIFVPFASSLHKKSNAGYYTLSDYFYHNYGKTSSYFASTITIIVMVGFLIINLIAASKVFEFFTGLSFWLSAILVAGIILIYLLLAGFKAVVKTDILQYIAIIFVLLTFTLILSRGVTIPAGEWNLFAAGATNIIGFLLIGLLFPFASPDLWQRVYAMPNKKVLKKSLIGSIIVFFLVAIILSIVGLLIKVRLPFLDPDVALIHGFAQLLPVGLSGLAIVVFFAAFMSSIDTYIYTASSALVQDFFRRLNKKKTVSMIRRAIFSLAIIATIITILLADLIQASFIFASFVIVLAIPTVATWIKPSIKRTTLNFTFAVGILALLIFLVLDLMQNNLTPMIVMKGIGGSLLGLVIGSIVSYVKR